MCISHYVTVGGVLRAVKAIHERIPTSTGQKKWVFVRKTQAITTPLSLSGGTKRVSATATIPHTKKQSSPPHHRLHSAATMLNLRLTRPIALIAKSLRFQ